MQGLQISDQCGQALSKHCIILQPKPALRADREFLGVWIRVVIYRKEMTVCSTSMPQVAHLNHSGMYWKVDPAVHTSSIIDPMQRQGVVQAMQQARGSAELLPDLCISTDLHRQQAGWNMCLESCVTAFTRLRILRA